MNNYIFIYNIHIIVHKIYIQKRLVAVLFTIGKKTQQEVVKSC